MRALTLVLLIGVPALLFAEETSFKSLASANHMTMEDQGDTFSGPGWEHIKALVQSAQHTLVGEDHFSNEIPRFANAIAEIGDFDNLYIEVDPFSTALIEQSLTEFTAAERAAFNREYGDLFSFYALKAEYRFLTSMVGNGSRLLGTDQIIMWADRLVLTDWVNRSESTRARKIYQRIRRSSAEHQQAFLKDSEQAMYMMTPAFEEQLKALESLPISDEEEALVGYLRTSMEIYQQQNHRQRVQLIKHHLMQDQQRWIGNRNLFKFGANHLTRGESFLTVHDIGVIIANLAEARYETSYHLMVLGESGEQGSPFRGFPSSKVDPEGFYQKHLQPFFELTEGGDWHVFDLRPLRTALTRQQLTVDSLNLRRSIMGYDTLVLIPELTPAGFPASE